MRFFTLSLLLFSLFQVFGQENYKIDTINRSEREQYIQKYHESNKQLIKKIKINYSKKITKKLQRNFKEFGQEFENTIRVGNFIFDKRFLVVANNILKELKEKNKDIPKNINVLISKDPSLNAYCLPDGTFVLNMGLFYWLKNEDQLASVMSHEIAHKLLEHAINEQVMVFKTEHSSQAKKNLKKIKKNKYNRVGSAFKLYKSQLYTNSENRRKKEMEADSLGLVLLKKTKFNAVEFIETLKLMKMYDTIRPSQLKKNIYARVFDLPNQKFDNNWMKCEDFSSYNYDLYKNDFNKDSIATHPEILARIKNLQISKLQSKLVKEVQPNISFTEVKKIVEYNIIPSLMYFEEYGLSIYLILKQIQDQKNVDYNKKLLGENFDKIFEARKKYQLNRYLDRVNPEKQSKSYIQFLNFMWNLNLTEIENIKNYYSQKTN